MNLFNTWIYQYFLNTEWFIWGIIVIVLGFTLLTPIFLWFSLTETKFKFNPIKYIKKLMDQEETAGS